MLNLNIMKFTLDVTVDFDEENKIFTVSAEGALFIQVIDKNLEYAFQELGARIYNKCSIFFNKTYGIDEAEFDKRFKLFINDFKMKEPSY